MHSTRSLDICHNQTSYKKKFVSVNTTRPLEEGHIRCVDKRSSDLAFFVCACLWTWPSSNGLAVFTLTNFFL